MGRLLSDIIIGTDLLDDASQIFFQSDYSSSEDGEVATTLCISLHARAESPAGEKNVYHIYHREILLLHQKYFSYFHLTTFLRNELTYTYLNFYMCKRIKDITI